jgi:hypothetical protein
MDSNSQPLFLAIATKPTELLNSVNYLLIFFHAIIETKKEKQLDSDETKRNLLAKKIY